MAEATSESPVTRPRIESPAAGRVEITGDLTFDTVAEIVSRGDEVLGDDGRITLDLRSVTRADSAGLALMVEWLREARRRGGRLQVVNMPEQMFSIAQMSKLDRVLLDGED